ncbi:MAG: hypothetical protein J5965_02720 [Aeriscardovia sp.]|nr:hypothetical protein [Aeriscardovia sp.]MBO6255135.1 hypothetical protein [Bacteroidaceae bacterium]
MNVAELLRNPDAKYFLIPLVTAILGVVAKVISQNDKIGLKRPIELFYLAPNLLMANFILILCEFSKYIQIEPVKQQVFSDACFSALLLNFGATIGITLYIRKFGWNYCTGHLRTWHGILIPDILVIVVMYFVFKTLAI